MASHLSPPGRRRPAGLARLAAGCLTLALAAGPVGAQQAVPRLTADDLEAWLDGFVPSGLDRGDLAGAVIVVVVNGQVLLQKGYGFADVTRRVPMDPARTVVPVASVSKSFTWTAAMQLVEAGKLELDRDVNRYLDFTLPSRFGIPITLRHLMTHTAGFEERIRATVAPGDPPRSLHAYFTEIPPPDEIAPPGTVQAYSNYGADLGGYLVERASGLPFVDYLDRHVLAPLGMTRSTFRWPLPPELRADLAMGYGLASSGQPVPPDANAEEVVGGPSGSLVATAADIARFMVAQLGRGQYPGGALFRPETADRMHAAAYQALPGAPATALGLFGSDYNGHRILLHDGDATGYHSDMELLLDDHVGFFSAVNSDGSGGLIGAAYAFRGALWHGFMDRYFPPGPAPELPTAATAKAHARAVAGEYEMSRRPNGDFMRALYLAVRVRVTAQDDGTIETPALLDFERGRPQRWREVGPFEWHEVGGRARLAMKVDGGRVLAWLPRDLSGFVLQPVPLLRSRAFNAPLLGVSAVVLVIATLGWPIGAIRRRRRGLPPLARVDRMNRIAALTGASFLLGWVLLLLAVSSGAVGFDPRLDRWIRLVHLIGVVMVAGAVVAWWSVWVGARERSPRSGTAVRLAVALALTDLVWFSFAFGLISRALNY
jgi:CubicO group peptidase (beta-lactamase class C family)